MIKYASYAVTFAEVPDEVCLTIQITNCPHRCEGCHSPYLQEDIGSDLDLYLNGMLKEYGDRVTCVCFMGDGNDIRALRNCLRFVKKRFGLKTAVYSGYTLREWTNFFAEDEDLPENLDYLKTGAYMKERGGLESKTTNQRMYRLIHGKRTEDDRYEDITCKFWKEKI